MRLPRITIVTPSLDQGRFLDATMRSVLGQEYPDLEYIVMDGGSTDGSGEIIRGYADRLAHWESAPDQGQADAIRRGFELSRGEILGWVNSDDLLLPGALDKVGRFFADHPGQVAAVGGGVLIDREGRLLQGTRKGLAFNLGVPPTYSSLLFWEMGGFYQPSCFFSKKAYLAAGGLDPSLDFCFDLDLYLHLTRQGRFGRVRGFLSAFREHPASKSATMPQVCLRERGAVRERHGWSSISPLRRYACRRAFVLANSLRKKHWRAALALGAIRLPDPAITAFREPVSLPAKVVPGPVSVVVCAYNGWDSHTRHCLESVLACSDWPDLEVVVVDNGSTDGTAEGLRELARQDRRVRVITLFPKRGYAGGANMGIRAASGRYLALLNNDTLVTSGWIAPLVDQLCADPRVGMATPVSNAAGNEQNIPITGSTPAEILAEGSRWARRAGGCSFELERPCFFCVMIRRDMVEQVGLLDEGFGEGYYEDDDFCLRAREMGYVFACREDSFVYHAGSATFSKVPGQVRSLMKRNRRRLERKLGHAYRPRHPRDRLLEVIESYLRQAEREPSPQLAFLIGRRLCLARSWRPRGLLKKIAFFRRVRELEKRADHLDGRGGGR